MTDFSTIILLVMKEISKNSSTGSLSTDMSRRAGEEHPRPPRRSVVACVHLPVLSPLSLSLSLSHTPSHTPFPEGPRPSQLGFLFGGDTAEPVAKVSSSAFADGSRQNAGNSITGRPSTRVVRPPGGASTFNIFGGSVAPAVAATPAVVAAVPLRSPAAAPPAAAAAAAVPAAAAAAAAAAAPPAAAAAVSTASSSSSSNSFACGSNMNSGNVITYVVLLLLRPCLPHHTSPLSPPPAFLSIKGSTVDSGRAAARGAESDYVWMKSGRKLRYPCRNREYRKKLARERMQAACMQALLSIYDSPVLFCSS